MSWLTVVLLVAVVCAALSFGMTQTCGGETSTTSAPCRTRSPAPFNKCHQHAGQGATRTDVMAFVLLLLGLALGIFVWGPNNGFTHLLQDLDRWL